MKNLTLTIDEDLLERAKVLAAERRTSINAMVRTFLSDLIAREQAKDDARDALLALARERLGDLGTQKWDREKLYDR